METDTFMNHVASQYKTIKTLFKSRAYNMNINFDEDIFNDTFIKCANKFNNDKITFETVIKYFWTSYINTYKTEYNKLLEYNIESIDEEIHDCIDDTYNEYLDDDYARDIYNKVFKVVENKFGSEEANIYFMYKYHDWDESGLIASGYNYNDLKDTIKKIHRFVKSYCKKNIK